MSRREIDSGSHRDRLRLWEKESAKENKRVIWGGQRPWTRKGRKDQWSPGGALERIEIERMGKQWPIERREEGTI